MTATTFDEQAFQEKLSDVRVDATGVGTTDVDWVKGWINRGATAVSRLASKYANRTGRTFSTIMSHFGRRRYSVEPMEEPGVGGYTQIGGDRKLAFNAYYVRMRHPFAIETAIHEPVHDEREENGSMTRLRDGLYRTFSYLGGFGRLVADYVQRIHEEMAATRLSQKIYEGMRLGSILGYPSLQPRLARYESAVGEERLVYNTERDAPLIADAVLNIALAPA